jgi:hypothetical protein
VRRVHTIVVDDLDGSAADTTIRFGLDGTDYEIDLNEEHANSFRQIVQSYISAARRISGTGRSGRGAHRRKVPRAPDSSQVRRWAKGQGLEVKDRGRVPADLVARYRAATGE